MEKKSGDFEYCIALGANLGNRAQNMQLAFDFLDTAPLRIIRRSGLYETEPWGFASHHLFLNACALVQTRLEPLPLLEKLKLFEKNAGRGQHAPGEYTDRLIDLDIIACGDLVLNTVSLVIPHPQMHKRAFVLEPFKEISPEWKHPVLKKTAEELLKGVA